ncbi:fimbrillin family protein [Bacteroides gallinarum]|uniref:fimbrillin family protein n=1 Tax=Bacteroides gallinarum TaxID=376806 RepID=UPI000367E4E6|nr:fimbrillin family protein [Bacteroides gallinarum]
MKNMYLWATIVLMALVACSNEDETAETNPLDYPADIHGTIKSYVPLGTTKSEIAQSVWANGTAIGVTTAAGISDLSYVVTDDRNVKYVYDTEKDAFRVVNKEGEDHNIYFKGPYTMTMTAYAPYVGERGTLAGVISAKTTEDKQTADLQPTIDFLYAEGGGSQKNTKVEFLFSHKMALLVLMFKTGSGVQMDNINYTLRNLTLDGTFDTSSGDITTGETMGNISMSLVKADEMISPLILFPQTLTSASILEVEMGGKTYAAFFETDTKMTSGSVYTFNVTIAPQAMTISPAIIEDWTVEEGDSHFGIAKDDAGN